MILLRFYGNFVLFGLCDMLWLGGGLGGFFFPDGRFVQTAKSPVTGFELMVVRLDTTVLTR
jgi:hypothetical protein